jgi:hypothetical protein
VIAIMPSRTSWQFPSAWFTKVDIGAHYVLSMPDTSFVHIAIRKVRILGVDDLTGAQNELTMKNLTKVLSCGTSKEKPRRKTDPVQENLEGNALPKAQFRVRTHTD